MEGLVDDAIIAEVWIWRRRWEENAPVRFGRGWECCETPRWGCLRMVPGRSEKVGEDSS